MISLDSETTGVDLRHGAKPFFVTICYDNGEQQYWEWAVDPLTREPEIPEEDLDDIEFCLLSGDDLVLQNCKFDVAALQTTEYKFGDCWPWQITYDTLLAGHLLGSNLPHDLTSMALQYLGVDIQPYEDALEVACNEARRMARSQFPEWRIAKADLPEMPSAKEKTWKYDTWLPRALAKELEHEEEHPWYTVLSDYANVDSSVTLALWKVMELEIKKRGLWEIYLERLKVLPIAYEMERRGVTLSGTRLKELKTRYSVDSEKAGKTCVEIARKHNYDLKLPKGASPNNSLRSFCFDVLKLETMINTKAKTSVPTLNKSAMEHYLATLPPDSEALKFVETLLGKRSRDTAIAYMTGYERFWRPISKEWYCLHPSLNPTGTDTLRWSSSQPNEQNISKKESFNLRYCFGPAPGREWWSLDAKNLELRIPAYESGERMMVDLFDRVNEPPYFGSYHLLIFDILHPEKFAKDGMKCKDIYESTWYQWTKNGNFAVTYGAVEASGTADRAYHVPGAQRRIKEKLKDLTALNHKYIAFAEKHGYVETLPDKTVNPNRGYPLLCTRSEWGRILPTVPFNYHVQGTAMWWMQKAMVRCYEYLSSLDEGDYTIALQVHDELVFDFPRGSGKEPWKTNLPKIRKIQRLMQQGGDDIGVPTPVSVEYHADNWSTGKVI